jgi:predicted HTH transcriptional regulator
VFEAKQAQATETAKLKQKHAESEAALEKTYLARISALEDENSNLIATIHRLQSPNQQLTLDETQTKILVFLNDGHEHLASELANHLNITTERARYHLNELTDKPPKLVSRSGILAPGVVNGYAIMQRGQQYLVEHDLPL